LSFYTGAHVSGIGLDGEYSGWVAPGGGAAPGPEPAALLLSGSGLIALSGIGRKRLQAGAIG